MSTSSCSGSEMDALEGLVGLKEIAIDVEKPTAVGEDRIAMGDTRVRQLKSYAQYFPDKCRNFRLSTVAAAAHAEDCYFMWAFWNKKVKIRESLFRFHPSVYLQDTPLEEALKNITTATQMEIFLKERYKTKYAERSRRPPPKIKRRMKNPLVKGVPSVAVIGGSSIPITLNTPAVKCSPNPEVAKVVHAATVSGRLLSGSDVHTLLTHAADLPISTAPPITVSASGSLFIYDRTVTPTYKKDAFTYQRESNNKLVVEKQPCIRVYKSKATDSNSFLARRSFIFRGDIQSNYVVVHYTREEPAVEDLLEEKEPQDDPLSTNTRALIALGASLHLPKIDAVVLCDAVNRICNECDEVSNSRSLEYSVLEHTARDVFGLEFDDLDKKSTFEKTWKAVVQHHEFGDIIRKQCTIVKEDIVSSLVPQNVRDAFESAVDEKASMAIALGKLRQIETVSMTHKQKIPVLVSTVLHRPLEWIKPHFQLICHAVLDNDIEYLENLIDVVLEAEFVV